MATIAPPVARRMPQQELMPYVIRSGEGVTCYFMDITPEIAAEWLAHGAPNRAIRPSKIKKHSRAMLAGRWRLNGETIKRDTTGALIDGQHRLLSVMKTGVTIRCLVVDNLPAAVMATVDTGALRQMRDLLKINGEVNSATLASCANWIWKYCHNDMAARVAANHDELEDVIRENREAIIAAVQAARAGSWRGVVPEAALAFMHFMGPRESGVPGALGSEFVHMLRFGATVSGEGLRADHPVHDLRERMLTRKQGKSYLLPEEILAILIKGWNNWMTGRRVRRKGLAWRRRGGEPFPKFVKVTWAVAFTGPGNIEVVV